MSAFRIGLGIAGTALAAVTIIAICRGDSPVGIVLCAMFAGGFLRMAFTSPN